MPKVPNLVLRPYRVRDIFYYCELLTLRCERRKLLQTPSSAIQLISYTSSRSSLTRSRSFHIVRFTVSQCVSTPLGKFASGKASA